MYTVSRALILKRLLPIKNGIHSSHLSLVNRISSRQTPYRSLFPTSTVKTLQVPHKLQLGIMSNSDYDEDVARAIALSLQPPSPIPRTSKVIDLVSEDDTDDDLNALIVPKTIVTKSAVPKTVVPKTVVTKTIVPTDQPAKNPESKDGGVSTTNRGKNIEIEGTANPSDEPGASRNMPLRQETPVANGILGLLNRKQMEEERRARAQKKIEESQISNGDLQSKKRKATTSPPAPQNREERTATLSHEPSSKRGKTTSLSRSTTPATPATLVSGNEDKTPKVMSYGQQAQAIRTPGIQYPDGVVKKTWVRGCPRQGDDIKIEEVLQKSDLELAVLSSFVVDPAWIETKLNSKTKVIWVLQEKDESEKQKLRSDSATNFRFCFPRMDGNINCMHSKLQLLAHPFHLRIVIPTANLVPYDWGETGVMENACFLIDLPRNPDNKATDPDKLTNFAVELLYFLTAMGLEQTVVDSMRNFDFSRTTSLAFIHSIGGSHTGEDLKHTGYCGLGNAIQKLGIKSEEALSVDYVSASIGSLDMTILKCLYLALQGDDGLTEFGWRTNKQGKGKGQTESAAERKVSDELAKRFRIYFATLETVEKTRGGKGAGGTICLQSKWFNKETFPRSLMRDCKSMREGILMHNKMMFVRPHKVVRGKVAWAYVGSANLSESAWGRLSKDKTTKEPKLNCRNWECGVIFVVPAGDTGAGDKVQSEGPPGMEVFASKIPVPMMVPGDDYAGRKPWYFLEQ